MTTDEPEDRQDADEAPATRSADLAETMAVTGAPRDREDTERPDGTRTVPIRVGAVSDEPGLDADPLARTERNERIDPLARTERNGRPERTERPDSMPIRIGFGSDDPDPDRFAEPDTLGGRAGDLALRPIPLRNDRLQVRTDRPQRRAMWIGIAVGVVAAMITVIALRAGRGFPEPRVELSSTVTPHVAGTPVPLAWPTDGQAAIAVEGQGSLGTSGPSTAQPIASVTKVMTAYVVLRDHPLAAGRQGAEITVSKALAATLKKRIAQGQSLLALPAGSRISEYGALQALLLPSADNVADLLAQWDAGSTSAFVARMNSTAARLGMTHTHYVDASGFEQGSVSSAADLLRLGEAATTMPVFTGIVGQRTAAIPGVGTVNNYNTLLGTDGVDGIKTGSTTPAGGCLLFSAHYAVDGHAYNLLGVVLGQRGPDILAAAMSASQDLVSSVEQRMRPVTIVAAGTVVGQLRPAYGRPVRVVTADPLRVAVLPGAPVTVATSRVATSAHPSNEQVGWLTAASGERVPLLPAHQVPAPSFWQRLGHIL